MHALLEFYGQTAEVLADAHFGFLVRDHDGIIAAVNRRLARWLESLPNQLVGHHVTSIAPSEQHPAMREAIHATNTGDGRARLTTFLRSDGTTWPGLFVPTRIVDEEQNFVGIYAVVVELGTIQTAKNVAAPPDVNSTLQRIAIELRSLSASSNVDELLPGLSHPRLAELSAREREIVQRIVTGMRVPGIAQELHVSPHTVRSHLKSIFRKLGVGSQSALIELVRTL